MLAAALGPHLDELSEAAQARAEAAAEAEREAEEAAATRRLTEAELMPLIFAHLDPDNPRVYSGIDFDRIVICEAVASAEPAPGLGAPGEPVEPPAPEPSEPEPEPELAAPDPRAWVGASWSDELGPIVELVDRPQLSREQHALLCAAARVELLELNLRHRDRRRGLRELQFFVELCRARGDRWCRVITGKGIESAGEPVLKRMVLEWCVARPPRPSGTEQVLGWAPEIDQYGEWGALILRLRARSTGA